MSDNKLVWTIMDAATLTALAASIGLIEKKGHRWSQRQRHKLCKVYRCHGLQRHAETVSRRPDDFSDKLKKWAYCYTSILRRRNTMTSIAMNLPALIAASWPDQVLWLAITRTQLLSQDSS